VSAVLVFHAHDARYAIDVTLNEMSAEPVGESRGELEVHGGVAFEASERGTREGFLYRVCDYSPP